MKRIALIMVALLGVLVLLSQNTPQETYVRRWAPIAVSEMYRSGVPASITLAQGLLESRYGLSPLATQGNNHFGIKCHKDWTGKTMSYDDDAKGECFRVYDEALESFQDHSDFLRYRDRYKFLFEFPTTDYKSWAYGLKKAGYATDPSYPEKLIKYIEDYKLYEYDTMSLADAEALQAANMNSSYSGTAATDAAKPAVEEKPQVKDEPKPAQSVVENSSDKSSAKAGKGSRRSSKADKAAKSEKSSKADKSEKASKADRKARHKDESQIEDEEISETIPQSPLSLEEPKKIIPKGTEEFRFSLKREAYSRNGVPFITSVEGETYSSIAQANDLFLGEILKFNDLSSEKELLPGTIVYLQAKKNQSEKGLDKYIVDSDDESLWEICQRFGVRMDSVLKMNGITESYQPHEGDTIVLRGKKIKH